MFFCIIVDKNAKKCQKMQSIKHPKISYTRHLHTVRTQCITANDGCVTNLNVNTHFLHTAKVLKNFRIENCVSIFSNHKQKIMRRDECNLQECDIQMRS